MDKRFQECNSLEKAWRYRHYIKIPFRWISWRIFHRDGDFNGITYWRILIGVAQSEMRWYYTEEEVESIFRTHFKDDEE